MIDHVGMVVKFENQELRVFDSNGDCVPTSYEYRVLDYFRGTNSYQLMIFIRK
jgi:hypothetical protein